MSISQLEETFEYKGRLCPKYRLKYDEEGEDYVEYTDQWKSYLKEQAILKSLQDMGLTDSCIKYGFQTYTGSDSNGKLPKLRKYIEQFQDRYKRVHLYFWSRANSTQKSTMAEAIIVELLKQGVSCQFVLMSKLLSLLTEESFKEDCQAQINKYREAQFLVIDDSFDPKKATLFKSGYQLSFLDTFLRQRLEVEKRATCFTSNVPIDEIEAGWTLSIAKLIERSIPDPMEFQDILGSFNNEDLWS